MGIPDFQVHILYLDGNVCQQREITLIHFNVISFHARHVTYKSLVINCVFYGVMHNTSQNWTMLTIIHYCKLLHTKGVILLNKVIILQLSHIILI